METEVNGLKIHYQIFGEGLPAQAGKPFLILHGWGSNSERWRPVAEKIAEKGCKVVVPDLPGFGESQQLDRPWSSNDYCVFIEKFSEAIGLSEFYLMGHSFGGAISAKFAIKFPQRINKLFLVSAACIREKTAKKKAFGAISKIVRIFKFIPFYDFFKRAVYKFIIRKSDYLNVDGVMKETYLNVIADDLSQFSGFIKVPTIIIWGEKDDSTPIENAHLLNRKIKNSKLVIIPGADHLLHKKIPDILAQKILENI